MKVEKLNQIKNRNAQLGATITLIIATIVIFFILAIFYFLSSTIAAFKFQKHADIVISYSNKEQALISLKAFLQTTAEIELEGLKTKIILVDLIRINSGAYDAKIAETASQIFKPFGKCYFFKTGTIKLGNSKFEEETATLNLPMSSEKIVDISLAVNSKCLETLRT